MRKHKIIKKLLLSLCIWGVVLLLPGDTLAYTSSVPVSVDVPSASLDVSGYASPGSLITVYDGNTPMATTVADSIGRYSKIITTIEAGLHSVSVSQKDIANVESRAASRLVNIPHQFRTQIEFIVPPTIALSTATATQGHSIQVSGYSTPNSTVRLIVDNQSLAYQNLVSNNNGYYSYLINTEGFSVGGHIVKALYDSPIGQSEFSKTLTFTTHSKTPVANNAENPPDTSPNPIYDTLPAPVITDPPRDIHINGNKITISGTTIPNSQIVVRSNGAHIGSVFALNDGFWSFEFYPEEIDNSLTVTACIDGRCSKPSAVLRIYANLSETPPCTSQITSEEYRYTIQPGESIELKLKFMQEKSKTILIDWGDGEVERFSVNNDRKYGTYKHAYLGVGQYNGFVASVDEANDCGTKKFFAVKVADSESDWGTRAILIPLGVVLSITIAYSVYHHRRKARPDCGNEVGH